MFNILLTKGRFALCTNTEPSRLRLRVADFFVKKVFPERFTTGNLTCTGNLESLF